MIKIEKNCTTSIIESAWALTTLLTADRVACRAASLPSLLYPLKLTKYFSSKPSFMKLLVTAIKYFEIDILISIEAPYN